MYAFIQNGLVHEIIAPALAEDGTEVPIGERFTPELVAQMVTLPAGSPVQPGWRYDGEALLPPLPPPPPTPEQNAAQRDALLTAAALRIAPLQDAADLDDATPEELAALTAWKRYRVALNRLDLSAGELDWPATPDA